MLPGHRDRRSARIHDSLTALAAEGFSGSVCCVDEDGILLTRAYGMADRSAGVACATETRFAIASVTKQFTAAAIVKLAGMGKLSLHDRLDEFFPAAPGDQAGITVHQLLTHASGIANEPQLSFHEPHDRRALMASAFAAAVDPTKAGTFFYSNLGYELLGVIIETVAGSFPEFLERQLFQPAGLHRTGFATPRWPRQLIARCYVEDRETASPLAWPETARFMGAGGIRSTAEDLAAWVSALATERVLSAQDKHALWTPYVRLGESEHWSAYGWIITEGTDGERMRWVNGSTAGFRCEIRWRPGSRKVICMCCNAVSERLPKPWEIIARIESLMSAS